MSVDRRRRRGVVTEFDADTGLGTISVGEERFGFHCASIADGTRRIDVGAEVTFVVLPKLGRYEATDVGP
jgi:cold shock CspA family protein